MTNADPTPKPRAGTTRTPWIFVAVTVIAGVAFVLGALREPTRAAFSYLVAMAYALTVVVGVLFWVMIGHTTSAVWFVALRRTAERVLAAFPALAILWIPLFFLRNRLLPVALDPSHAPEGGEAYGSWAFLIVRTAAYFATWCVLGAWLWRGSLHQDTDPRTPSAGRLRAVGSVGLPVAGIALTFAAFDWLMVLDDPWKSTMYGVYVAAGAALAGLSFIAVLAEQGRSSGRLPSAVGVSHFFVIGKLFLMLVLFWAYTGFSQLLLIWIADLPAENVWYLARSSGSWAGVAWTLGIGHFALPLVLLLSWRLKRSPARVTKMAALLLVMHFVDVYWLVLPALDHAGPRPSWLDVAALVAVGGAAGLVAWFRTRHEPPVPVRDPNLERSLAFENA